MEDLLAYINGLSPQDREAFELELRRLLPNGRTSIGYLRKAISKGQKLGAEICVAVESASARAVTRRALRPDDWMQIWPELQVAA